MTVRKDSPAVGDVHVSTTGGARRQRKAPISPDTKLPVTGATMAAQAENPDDDPVGKIARTLKPNHEDGGETALSPFPYDPNALANIRPDQTPRFFGALTDADKLPTKRMRLSDLTAMQNRVDPKKVEGLGGASYKQPVVVSMNDRHYIADGHHRATRAWLDGESEIDVKHKDLEPVSNALKRADVLKLFDVIEKARDADADADEKVTAALTQIMHDCSCAMGAQCADNALGDGKGGKTSKRDDTAGGDDAWSIPFKIAKADPDQQLIFGWASVSEEGGRLLVDKQGDSILPEDLEKAAYDFVLHARQHGEMHKIIGTGKLVESMMFTTEKQAALGISIGKVGWWVGFKVSDPDTWAAHKAGHLPEFSIGGSGRRVEA